MEKTERTNIPQKAQNIWETKQGYALAENLNSTLNELRDYMRTQNEINKAVLSRLSSINNEVLALHINKQDKVTEEVEIVNE